MPYRRQHHTRVTWYASFRDQEGRQVQERAGTKRQAEQLERQRKREVKAGTYSRQHKTGVVTVARYAATWIKQRTNRARDKDWQILRDYILPELGKVRLDRLTTAHGVKLARKVAQERSSSTVSSVMRVLRVLGRDAALEGLIPSNPITLPRGLLPTRRGAQREIYDPDEVELLLGAGCILPHIRVMMALAFYTGMRKGEICGRRWCDLDEIQPLWSLSVDTQYDGQPLKTDHPRVVPVHPELLLILQAWWRVGWELYVKRPPRPEDFIVPVVHRQNRTGCLSASGAYKAFIHACKQVGVEAHSMHSTRHTFVTAARRGGAPKDLVERITHNARGDIVDRYTHYDWAPLCNAVLCVGYANGDAAPLPPALPPFFDGSPDAHGLTAGAEAAGSAVNLSEAVGVCPVADSRGFPEMAACGDARRAFAAAEQEWRSDFRHRVGAMRAAMAGSPEAPPTPLTEDDETLYPATRRNLAVAAANAGVLR